MNTIKRSKCSATSFPERVFWLEVSLQIWKEICIEKSDQKTKILELKQHFGV